MVDTLLHHYQRLWKATATIEILETRPRSSSKHKSGLLRNCNSVTNLYNSPYLPIQYGSNFSSSSYVPSSKRKISVRVPFLSENSNYIGGIHKRGT